jgi:hypothetical protein
MKTRSSWNQEKDGKKTIISSSISRLNNSLGDYLMAIKSLNNTLEGTPKSR